MRERIIKHWCIFYVWLLKFFEIKKIKAARQIAERLLISMIMIYAALYIVLPVIILFQSDQNPLRGHRLLVTILIAIVTALIVSLIGKSKRIKEILGELENVEDWHTSSFYKKGRRIVWFHFVFSVLSVPIVIKLG
jgi:hypothetical protein